MKKRVTLEPVRPRPRARVTLVEVKRELERSSAGTTGEGSTVPEQCAPCGPGYANSGTQQVTDEDGLLLAEWRCPPEETITTDLIDINFNSGAESVSVYGGGTESWPTSGWTGTCCAGRVGSDGSEGFVRKTLSAAGTSPRIAATPGVTYRFTFDVHGDDAGGSITVRFFDASDAFLAAATLYPTTTVDAWLLDQGGDVVAPDNTAYFVFTPAGSVISYDHVRVQSLVTLADCDKKAEPVGPYGVGTQILAGANASGSSSNVYDLATDGDYILWVSVDGLHRTDYTFIPPDQISFSNAIPSGAQVFVNYRA